MERLPFSLFRSIVIEYESFSHYFDQLLRDYDRELNSIKIQFAIDFSELYNFIHYSSVDAKRKEVTQYIFRNTNDSLTILPGCVGELTTDLNKLVTEKYTNGAKVDAFNHPYVQEFIDKFPNISNEKELINLYSKTEPIIHPAIISVVNILVSGYPHSAIEELKYLLEHKISPIQGLDQVKELSTENINLMNLVKTHLCVSKPFMDISNTIDSLDFIIAYSLNQLKSVDEPIYTTIYSHASHFIQACRSHPNLMWENDYIIRDLKYFQYRTKIQEQFSTLELRKEKVLEWKNKITYILSEISKLIDIDEQLEERESKVAYELLDAIRDFDESVKKILFFSEGDLEKKFFEKIIRQAEVLYKFMVENKSYEGESEEAIEVFKVHLKEIHKKLKSFTPIRTDSKNIIKYKKDLSKWLGV